MDVFDLIPKNLAIGMGLGVTFLGEMLLLFKLIDAVKWPFKSPADWWKAAFAWVLLPIWTLLCWIVAMVYVVRGIVELRF